MLRLRMTHLAGWRGVFVWGGEGGGRGDDMFFCFLFSKKPFLVSFF